MTVIFRQTREWGNPSEEINGQGDPRFGRLFVAGWYESKI
jgi:hypothetical protein